MAAGKKMSKTFVWILLGLLILGLGGFGVTNLGGTVRTVGKVGSQIIEVNDYARELQREIRAIEAQTGAPLQMSQVEQMGLDRIVLARLVALAAIDHEVAELGLSIGDANLQKEIVSIEAFHGIDGKFDRDSYRFALDRAGISEVDFEQDLRAESARTLVQGAIAGGVEMPAVLADTITGYVGARRSFTLARLDETRLEAPLPEPSDADLRAYYDANPGDFTLPETKRLTYALLTPEMILDQVEIDEEAVRKLYESRAAEYDLPERRLVERLVFPDESAAASAKAQLEVGGTTFEQLVRDRGLELDDIDLGDVTQEELEAAAETVFAAAQGHVVGPLPSPLGPALFRINGILEARSTSFEDAEPELRDELAGDRARRMIEAQAENIDDLLAGGATLEELAGETEMELGTLDWTEGAYDGVAAYDAFREAAAAVTADDFPEVVFLEDGGLFALRLDERLPPRPQPFDEARDRVRDGWTVEQTEAALRAEAEKIVADLAVDGDFAATGLKTRVENGLTRTAFIDGTPPGFMKQVFEMDKGELRIISGGGAVLIVRLNDILPPEDSEDFRRLKEAYSEELDQTLAQALFNAFMFDAQQRARPALDERALNAVRASFQ